MRLILAASLIVLFLVECTISTSPGRSYLESNCYPSDDNHPAGCWFPPSVSANLVGCARDVSNSWALLAKYDKADTYVPLGSVVDLRVVPDDDSAFSCDFKFSSAKELNEKTLAAIKLTLANYSEREE